MIRILVIFQIRTRELEKLPEKKLLQNHTRISFIILPTFFFTSQNKDIFYKQFCGTEHIYRLFISGTQTQQS